MSRGLITCLTICIGLVLSFPSAGATAREKTAREKTEKIFSEILAAAGGNLSVLVNESDGADVELGEKVSFQFAGDRDGYLTVLYVDAHGNAALLFPTDHPGDARVKPGSTLKYPPASTDLELEAVLPVGVETLFAISTPNAIPVDDLGMKTTEAGIRMAQSDQVPVVARQLASLVGGMPKGSVSAKRNRYRVIYPNMISRGLSSDEIVESLSTRSRSIERPKIDLDIKFATGSFELTPQAKKDLDEVGKAMMHPRIARSSFKLVGHTDDTGSNDFNMKLSKQRADAARSYIIDKYELSREKIESDGRGEEEPLISAEAGYPPSYGWSQNRRVTLELSP